MLSKHSTDKIKILVIDDEADAVQTLQDRLEMSGFEVATASNGVEGLNKALEERPDVILLDLIMPIMDGQEMLEALRKQPGGDFSSVIVVSARTQTHDVARANACGIDDYIIKPFDMSELLKKIRDIVKSRKAVAK